ncbi:MAG: hypothetical protein ACXVIJ_04360, partial [Thermoanaerobaculia bacterium]
MKYRRVLLITELGSDPRRLVAMIRRIAPTADLLIVVARLPARKFAWFSTEAPDDLKEAADASMDALRDAAAGAAHHVDVRLEPDLVANDLAELTAVAQIDLLVAGALSQSGISVIAELRQRRSLAVLWTVGVPFRDRPISEVRCVALGSRARAAVAAFLRDHGDRTLHATVVLPAPPP